MNINLADDDQALAFFLSPVQYELNQFRLCEQLDNLNPCLKVHCPMGQQPMIVFKYNNSIEQKVKQQQQTSECP